MVVCTRKTVKSRKKVGVRAFTMAEFIVVISIIVLMLGFVSFDYQRMQQVVEASNVAEDIALTLRQAQTYGLSSSARFLGGGDFNDEDVETEFFERTDIVGDGSVNGVALLYENENDSNPTIYLYQDTNGNFRFDSSDRVIDVRKVTTNNVSIHRVRFHKDSQWGEKVLNDRSSLSVSFQRPYPDAYIVFGSGGSYSLYDKAIIIIDAGANEESVLKTVSINSIGNIAVRNRIE